MDTDQLVLPKDSCAQYMRREELKTVNDVQKAVQLSQYEEFQLNSDGTTLAQRKIGAATINGMVVSVNELANGSAEHIAKDITKEFENLREIAQALGLDNANSINWSLVASSTSDSASTQKKFNEIAKQKKQEDMDRFGTNTKNGEELIANFCVMHLGVNLRKALEVQLLQNQLQNSSMLQMIPLYMNFVRYLEIKECQNMALGPYHFLTF